MNGYVFCQNCGKKVKKGVKFCPNCGHQLIADSSQGQNANAQDNNEVHHINPQMRGANTGSNNQQGFQKKVDSIMNMKQDTHREEEENQRKMESMNIKERIYIDNKVKDEAPSLGVAYILWLFFGGLGVHHFYLHQTMAGVFALLDTFIFSWIFGLGLIINFIWWIIDACLMPMYVSNYKAKIKRRAIDNIMLMRN